MALPFALVGFINHQFTDGDGVPLAGGFVETRVQGSGALKDTYADSDSVSPTVNPNPTPLDADGRAAMFVEAGAYDFEVQDSSNVPLYVIEYEDIGLTFLANLGVELNDGARDVTSGYTVLATDNTITVDSTGGADPCIINLPPVADRGLDLTIINLGTISLAITPNGSETINLVAAAFDVDASASPVLSTVTLRPDPASNWWALLGTVSGGGGGGVGTVTHTTAALAANQLVLGNGSADVKPLGSLGTTTTVYHGNAAGAGSFAAVNLTTDVTGVLPVANFATGTPTGSKFVRDDGTLQSIAGGGDALIANPLSQFAATTSAQLRTVLSDETGTGLAYFQGGALGTPASGVGTNLTAIPTTALTGALPAANEPAHTGDVTNSAASLALTIAANAVTNAKLATMPTATIKANITGGTAVPTDVTYAALATAMNTLSIPLAADTQVDFGKAYIDLQILTSAPAAPAAGYGRLYMIDNGGKVEYAVRFPTGAVQQIEIEP